MTLPQQPPTGMMEWIEHDGKGCPVEPETRVHVRLRVSKYETGPETAGDLDWHHVGAGFGDIIAYRVVRP